MGSELFPSSLYARIHPDGYDAEPVFAVTTQKARDLSELRLYHGQEWRCSFRLITRTAAERTTLRDFYAARYGGWDSFFFTSRDDLVQRRVKFAALTGQRIGPNIWEYQITLLQTNV